MEYDTSESTGIALVAVRASEAILKCVEHGLDVSERTGAVQNDLLLVGKVLIFSVLPSLLQGRQQSYISLCTSQRGCGAREKRA